MSYSISVFDISYHKLSILKVEMYIECRSCVKYNLIKYFFSVRDNGFCCELFNSNDQIKNDWCKCARKERVMVRDNMDSLALQIAQRYVYVYSILKQEIPINELTIKALMMESQEQCLNAIQNYLLLQ